MNDRRGCGLRWRVLLTVLVVAQPLGCLAGLAEGATTPTDPAGRPRYAVPKEYGVGQITAKSGALAVTSDAGAFQFWMPDGAPGKHDYALEGMPIVGDNETIYPVVVNSITHDPPNRGTIPERRMANWISAMSGSDLVISQGSNYTLIEYKKHAPAYAKSYYFIMPSVGSSGRLSGLFDCPYNDAGPFLPSSCAGWTYAEDLSLVMRLRFPRNKIGFAPEISRIAYSLMQSWLVKQ